MSSISGPVARLAQPLSRHGLVALAYVAPPVLLVWWAWNASAHSTNYLFPPLSDTIASLRTNWLSQDGLAQIWPSVRNLLAGYTIATVVGVAMGAVLGASQRVRQMFLPVIDFMRSLPPPVLLPLGVLVLGIGSQMKVAVIVFGCVWPMMYGAMEGVRSTEPVRLAMGRVFRVRHIDHWRFVVLPGAAPHIVAGMRAGLQIAFVLIVISELIASDSGIGFSILQASRTFRYADMWAGALMLGLLGLLLNLVFGAFSSVVLRWRTAENRARSIS